MESAMSGDMRIRPFRVSRDLESLRALGFPERHIRRYGRLGPAWRILGASRVCRDQLFVLTPADSDRVVGTIVLNGRWVFSRLTAQWKIHGLFVASDLRRRGLAERLMRYIFAYLQQREARQVSLKVDTENAPAIALYEKLGFTRKHARNGSAYFTRRLP